jgi:hypothetical protein
MTSPVRRDGAPLARPVGKVCGLSRAIRAILAGPAGAPRGPAEMTAPTVSPRCLRRRERRERERRQEGGGS